MTYGENASAIETLTTALDDPDPMVRYAAAGVLGDVGDKVPIATVQALVNHLQDNDPWVRQQTIAAIQRLIDVAVPRYGALGLRIQTILLKLTKDHDPFVQSGAIGALEKWEDFTPQVFDAYKLAEDDEIWLVRSKARRSLLSKPGGWAASIDVLGKYLRDEDKDLRLFLVNLLRQKIISSSQPHEEIVNLLARRLNDPDSQIVYEAIWLLALTKHPKAIDALAWKADNSSVWLKTIKTALLNSAGVDLDQVLDNAHRDPATFTSDPSPIDHGNTDKLIALLAEKDKGTRVRAVVGLCWIPDAEAENAIIAATRDDSVRVRYAAAYSLNEWTCQRKHSESIIGALQPLLEDSNLFVRRQALASLNSSGWNHPERRRECIKQRADWLEILIVFSSCKYTPFITVADDRAILPLLEIPYDKLREAAVSRLAWSCLLDQKPLLQRLLKDRSARVRKSIVWQLRRHPDFVPLLLSALQDENEQVRLFAAQSLSQFGHASAVAPLKELAEHDQSMDVRNIANSTLQQISHHVSMSPQDWDVETRRRLDLYMPTYCK